MAKARSQRLDRLISGSAVGVAVGVLAAIAALSRPAVLERGEFWTYDYRARSAAGGKAAASPDIVILEITEQDLEDAENAYGVTWPWPREMFGYLAGYTARAGGKAIIYDWLFQDRGQYSVSDAETFATAMREAGNAVIGMAMTRAPQVARATEGPWVAKLGDFASLEEAQPVALQLLAWNTRSYLVPARAAPAPGGSSDMPAPPAGDGAFTLYYGGKASADDVLKTNQRLMSADELVPLFGDPPAEPAPIELSAEDLAREVTIHAIIAARDGLDLAPGNLAIPVRRGLDPPLAPIAAAPAHAGNVYQDFEADGIMRRHTPLFVHDGKVYPSLALASYLAGHPEVTPKLRGNVLVFGTREVPLDDEARIGIRFHGAHVYDHLRAFEVLHSQALLDEAEGKILEELVADGMPEDAAAAKAHADAATRAKLTVPFEQLAGKYVIVSASGQALRDIRVTPVSKVQEGAEVQATALDNLERGEFIQRVSPWTDAAIAFLLALFTSVAMVFLWSAIPRGSLALLATFFATALVLFGYWGIASWTFDAHGLWFGFATPALGVSVSAFAALLVTSAAERRGRRFVQEALGRYTSPELVKELVAHPEYLSLEWGERRPMSVYFSDIAGFTSFSEKMSPERLVALLNDYLTQMTEIVLEHGGVVDKYIGDAVMAFWGAPLKDADHARKAILCAIAMGKRCDQLRARWLADYGAEVYARAGVNSGFAVVGNMGSKHKYNYTVMGDMVNLASRLEGSNKPYGTYLMISEFTLEAIGPALVDVRELDYLAVKGKEQPVRVYEVLDLIGQTDEVTKRAVPRYLEGLAKYRDRDFDGAITSFEAALQEKPDDGPSLLYIERCRHFLDEPPEPGWTGAWQAKEK